MQVGEHKAAHAGVRGLNTCRIQFLFDDRTRQTFSDQNSGSFNTSISATLIDLRKTSVPCVT
jgi:hypothetical protein